ncbi:glucose-1-phosphate adenylyltransferase [Clostridium sp.]|uniref:glucose-1-phosphate adenylyltransferase n=1 Tax=Clostridium sp. TaxID=1506 RepID=UPI003217CFDC
MMKREIMAMILAGGKGTRLGNLTKKIAKPAVYYGGKYRIIDFPLSNCANSHINAVGILTQYESVALNSYIGIGDSWGLNTRKGGVTILPPRETEGGSSWYKGTADAIYQNIDYIDENNPEYILILSGDHIYKMDYSSMLDFHKEKKADATIAVIKVPYEEASRFGIMNANEDSSIYEFDEKPKNPKSNLASMGIYIFNWKTLKKFLKEDAIDKGSSNDFGKNIIPKMLGEGKQMYAYNFEGYWKDVGTIESLWQANMDLLNHNEALDLYDKKWRIYSNNVESAPQYVGDDAIVKNSMVSQGCTIYGNVENSVIFTGVYIGAGSKVKNSVIMPDAKVESGVEINNAIISKGATVDKYTRFIREKNSRVSLVEGDDNNSLGFECGVEVDIYPKDIEIEIANTSLV